MSKARELSVVPQQSIGFKNRIINGGMQIDQRNNGASVTVSADGQYTIDRWRFSQSQNSKFTCQRSTVAPTGFSNSMLITVASAVTPSVSDYFGVFQLIEGLNVADLGWGTANAQTVTLSFWARSSLTGTFSGMIFNGSANRSYCFTYTINAANTLEYKTITIPGDTTGTWQTDNNAGIIVYFDLGSGNNTGTSNSWQGTIVRRTSSSVQLVATAGATFYITGVQLEKGSTATSFDYRPYGTELQLCQRYYEVLSVDTNNATWLWTSGPSKFFSQFFPFAVVKRTTPTGTATFSNSKFVIPGTLAVDGTAVHTMSNYTATTTGFNVQVPGVATISATNAYSYSYEGSFQVNSSAEL